jgi:hypothetical protein
MWTDLSSPRWDISRCADSSAAPPSPDTKGCRGSPRTPRRTPPTQQRQRQQQQQRRRYYYNGGPRKARAWWIVAGGGVPHKNSHSTTAEGHNFLDFMSDAYEDCGGHTGDTADPKSSGGAVVADSSGMLGRVAAALADICDMEDTSVAASVTSPDVDKGSDDAEGGGGSLWQLAYSTAAEMCDQQREMMEHREFSSSSSSSSSSSGGSGEVGARAGGDSGEEGEGWAAELTSAHMAEPCHPQAQGTLDAGGFVAHCWATASDLLTGADYLYDSS